MFSPGTSPCNAAGTLVYLMDDGDYQEMILASCHDIESRTALDTCSPRLIAASTLLVFFLEIGLPQSVFSR